MKHRTTLLNTKANTWFSDPAEFRQLCGDAQAQAIDDKSQGFAAEMTLAANQHGLETYLSITQLEYLCRLAQRDVPERRNA